MQTDKRTQTMVFIALMTAVSCVLGPLALPLPFSPVPVSLTNLAVYFSVYVLGRKQGVLSRLIYLLLGLVGLPVFSSFTGGPAKLFGPTGGYLFGSLLLAWIQGFFLERWPRSRTMQFLGMALGTAVLYLFGTLWLAKLAGLDLMAALAAGVIPFIPADLGKILLALIAGP